MYAIYCNINCKTEFTFLHLIWTHCESPCWFCSFQIPFIAGVPTTCFLHDYLSPSASGLTWCSRRRKRRKEIPIFLLNTSCPVTHRRIFLTDVSWQEVLADFGGGTALMTSQRNWGSKRITDWWLILRKRLNCWSLTCLLIWAHEEIKNERRRKREWECLVL